MKKMNLEWEKIAERGQSETGYIDIFRLIGSQRAIAIINYFPQYEEVQQKVVLTVMLEGDKKRWTEGKVKQIFFDAEFRIKNVELVKYNNWNNLDFMFTQVFTMDNIDNFDYLSHGDMGFDNA